MLFTTPLSEDPIRWPPPPARPPPPSYWGALDEDWLPNSRTSLIPLSCFESETYFRALTEKSSLTRKDFPSTDKSSNIDFE